MSISEIQAIDVHAHLGRMQRGKNLLIDELCSGDAQKVLARAAMANTRWTIVTPLDTLFPPLKADTFAANQRAVGIIAETEGLFQWAVLNPIQEQTYEQVAQMLELPKCLGIKIHPEEHGYPIKEQGRAIFEFAARHQAIVLTHSGQEYSMPEDFIPFANDFPEATLILAHIGNTCDNDSTHHLKAIQASTQGNVYADTSSSNNITPGLLELTVNEVGADRILYGTDSPLYFTPMQRARIDYADLDDRDKRLILHDNAASLFNLD